MAFLDVQFYPIGYFVGITILCRTMAKPVDVLSKPGFLRLGYSASPDYFASFPVHDVFSIGILSVFLPPFFLPYWLLDLSNMQKYLF